MRGERSILLLRRYTQKTSSSASAWREYQRVICISARKKTRFTSVIQSHEQPLLDQEAYDFDDGLHQHEDHEQRQHQNDLATSPTIAVRPRTPGTATACT